jgi:hypothetical protein
VLKRKELSQICCDDKYNKQIASISFTNSGGQKIGSIREKKTTNEVITKCAVLYQMTIETVRKKGLTNVPNGTLKN